jgi:hypothetical protein
LSTTLSALPLNFHPYAEQICRIVEGQHYIATRRLVDTVAEHEILESLIEASKPFAPMQNKNGELHYLLFTPFRYPPLREGGRFHRTFEQSLFYGSEKPETAMAEVAYRRFMFQAQTSALFSPFTVPHTLFYAMVRSDKSIDLTKPPFDTHREAISHPASYAFSQPLGTRMRTAGAEVFKFFSARREGEVNVSLFSVEAFASNKPEKQESITVFVSKERVEVSSPSQQRSTMEYSKSDFEVNGLFPMIG